NSIEPGASVGRGGLLLRRLHGGHELEKLEIVNEAEPVFALLYFIIFIGQLDGFAVGLDLGSGERPIVKRRADLPRDIPLLPGERELLDQLLGARLLDLGVRRAAFKKRNRQGEGGVPTDVGKKS